MSNLLEPSFLRKLEALTLLNRRARRGASAGPRRSPALGSSVEFADFRSYSPGDDFRRIDWNAYARLERLFLRLYRAEENLSVTFFVDCSASMDWGMPHKGHFVRQLAGALAYIALVSFDRVAVAGFAGELFAYLPPVAGPAAVWRVWPFLEALPFGGETDLNGVLRGFARHRPGPGLAFVLSDLLAEAGYQAGIKALLAARQEVILLHVLAPDELAPDLVGDWRLTDAEGAPPVELTANSRAVRAYRERLAAYIRELRGFCHTHGVAYERLSSGLSLEDAVLRQLRRAQIIS